MSSSTQYFTLTLSSWTDLTELEKKLNQTKDSIVEAQIRIDASFIVRLQNRHPPDSATVGATQEDEDESQFSSSPPSFTTDWNHDVLQILGHGLQKVRKLSLWGPFSASVPISYLTVLLRAISGGDVMRISQNHMRLTGTQDEHEKFINVLQEYYSSNLQELRMSGVSFGTNDVRVRWMQALAHFPSLQIVAINGTNNAELVSVLHATSLQALFTSVALQKVVLFSFIFSDEETASVLDALANNTSIREASLGLTCGSLGGPALTELLRNNATLEKLWLRMHFLDDDANNQRVAEALRTASHLQEFGLYGERYLSTKSAGFFADMLQEDNTTLKELELQSCSDFAEDLHFFLSLNQIGRGPLLQGDFSNHAEWVKALVKARYHLSCIFFLLITNPTLCSRE